MCGGATALRLTSPWAAASRRALKGGFRVEAGVTIWSFVTGSVCLNDVLRSSAETDQHT